MRGPMYRVLPLLITLVAGTAAAQPAPAPPGQPVPRPAPAPTPPPAPAPAAAPAPTADTVDLAAPEAAPSAPGGTGYTFDGVAPRLATRRSHGMELGFRGRVMSVPKSILDAWYFDGDDQNWAWIDDRPKIWGYGLGLEYVVKSDSSNGIFYVEFVDSMMPEGYWDDVEEPPDHLDGDFLSPSAGVGLVAFGADYAYEAHIVETSSTMGRFGMSFLVGGGLGLGVLTGTVQRWGPDDDGNPAYKRYLDGEPPDEDKELPRVFPMVDVNAGLRFNFGERYVVRVEGGLHTLLYYGISTGIAF